MNIGVELIYGCSIGFEYLDEEVMLETMGIESYGFLVDIFFFRFLFIKE